MNKKTIKLENNKEYFSISELNENNETYLLLMNIDNESDIVIAKKLTINNEDFITIVTSEDTINNLKVKFKSLVDADKNIYL